MFPELYERKIDRTMRELCQLAIPLELKTLSDDGRFAGYASVFGVTDSQRDVVMRGAFVGSIAGRIGEIKLLWQHQLAEPIGYFTTMFEDSRGLYVEGQLLLEVARAQEAHVLMKQGVVRGLSIGYAPIRYTRDPDSGVRRLHEVALYEVSLVTLPANEHSQITLVKGQANLPETPQDWEGICVAIDRALLTLR